MSLTLKVEQRLDAVGLITFFDKRKTRWKRIAQRTYNFVRESFPTEDPVRRDDVAQALLPILQVDKLLGAERNKNKLTQQYWISYFTDLIIDRVWDELDKGKQT